MKQFLYSNKGTLLVQFGALLQKKADMALENHESYRLAFESVEEYYDFYKNNNGIFEEFHNKEPFRNIEFVENLSTIFFAYADIGVQGEYSMYVDAFMNRDDATEISETATTHKRGFVSEMIVFAHDNKIEYEDYIEQLAEYELYKKNMQELLNESDKEQNEEDLAEYNLYTERMEKIMNEKEKE